MKQRALIVAAIATAALATVGCEKNAGQAAGSTELESLEQQVSYVFGYNIGQQFKTQQIELDPQVVAQAISDGNNDAEPKLSEQEMQTAMQTFQQQYEEKMAALQQEREAEREASAAANEQKGKDFLAENANKEGVEVLPSGLQLKQI